MYHVERAIFDLRRGLPVVIVMPQRRLLVQALENSESLRELATLSGSRPAMVLTQHRLAALGHSISAEAATLPLSHDTHAADLYRLAVDRQSEKALHLSGLMPAELGERGALALMRRALLLPAALCADIANGAGEPGFADH